MFVYQKLKSEQKLFRRTELKPVRRTALKNGFTLIELLVVVLIIGILAAIALPQHEMAVHKARMAEGLAFVKAIKDAQRVYYMANGEFTGDMAKLDVQPAATGQYFSFVIHLQNNSGHTNTTHVEASYARYLAGLWMVAYLYPDRDFVACVAGKGSEKANRLCKTMGTLTAEDPEGWGSNNYYAI